MKVAATKSAYGCSSKVLGRSHSSAAPTADAITKKIGAGATTPALSLFVAGVFMRSNA